MQISEEVRGPWVEGRLLRTMVCISTTTSTPLPVFPVSLMLNKVEVSRADMICSLPLRRPGGGSELVFQEQGDSMIRRVNTQHFVLVFFFTFCQVIGTMCALPDFSVAADAGLLVEEGMACPMGGTTMCPPSLTSSSERQIKHGMVSDVDHAPTLLGSAAVLTVQCMPALSSLSSAGSMVPISISSPSVLRI